MSAPVIPRGREGYQSLSNKAGVECLEGNSAGRRITGTIRLRKALKITMRTLIVNVDT